MEKPEEVDIDQLPYAVQNTIHEHTLLTEMAKDRLNHPQLASDMREARLMRESYTWQTTAERFANKEAEYQEEIARLQKVAEERRLKSVEEESHADGNAGSA